MCLFLRLFFFIYFSILRNIFALFHHCHLISFSLSLPRLFNILINSFSFFPLLHFSSVFHTFPAFLSFCFSTLRNCFFPPHYYYSTLIFFFVFQYLSHIFTPFRLIIASPFFARLAPSLLFPFLCLPILHNIRPSESTSLARQSPSLEDLRGWTKVAAGLSITHINKYPELFSFLPLSFSSVFIFCPLLFPFLHLCPPCLSSLLSLCLSLPEVAVFN